MKFKYLLILSFFLSLQDASALSLKGSPDRCTKKNWSEIDDLLPPTWKYPKDDMSEIKAKISKARPDVIFQSVVNHLLTYYDLCGQPVAGVGGWTDQIGTALCERLAAYNMIYDGLFSSTNSGPEGAKKMYSDEDLNFLQSVFKVCRPTTQRWWLYPLIVHVSFEPTSEEYDHFKGLLKDEFVTIRHIKP